MIRSTLMMLIFLSSCGGEIFTATDKSQDNGVVEGQHLSCMPGSYCSSDLPGNTKGGYCCPADHIYCGMADTTCPPDECCDSPQLPKSSFQEDFISDADVKTVLCLGYPDGRFGPATKLEGTHLNFGSSFTVEMWVYLNSMNGGQLIFNKWAMGAEDKFIGLTPAPTAWFFPSPNISGGSVSIGWHHFAAEAKGGNDFLYVDGNLVASGIISSVDNSDGFFRVGAKYRDGVFHSPVDGCFSEVRVSSIARYSGTFIPQPNFTTDKYTVALWAVNEGTGTIVKDSSPNHNNAAIFGTTSWETRPNN